MKGPIEDITHAGAKLADWAGIGALIGTAIILLGLAEPVNDLIREVLAWLP